MDCVNPVICWRCGHKMSKDGVLSPRLVFSEREALAYVQGLGLPLDAVHSLEMAVPCGKCLACQMRKRKDMTVRLSHECRMHEHSCFLTLTYDDDHIPVTDWRDFSDTKKTLDFGLGNLPERTLLPSDVQRFVKRLRRWLTYQAKRPRKDGIVRDHVDHIRYFAVGEYGGKTRRPHYHILIFGWTPSDLVLHGKTKAGSLIYRSAQIEKQWTFGFSSVAPVDEGVAKYCARYVTKKFARLDDDDLTSRSVVPEFTLQSVKGGAMGAPWFDQFGAHACEVGFCTVKCHDKVSKYKVPQYYMRRLRKTNVKLWCDLRDQRLDFIQSMCNIDLGECVSILRGIRSERAARLNTLRYRLECERERESI